MIPTRPPRRPARVLLALLVLLPALASAAERTLLASVHPLALIASAVAGADTKVKVLLPPGTSLHDYQLRPADMEAVAAADVVVWMGADAEPYLAALLREPKEGRVVIDMSALPGINRREYRLERTDERGHGLDPHLWLSTRNATQLGIRIAEALGDTTAARHFVDELQRHRNRQSLRFAPLAQAPLFASSDAFGFFVEELGLQHVSALAPNAETPATPRRLTQLAERAAKEPVRCLVAEPGFEQGTAQRVFSEGGRGRVVVIDPEMLGIPLSRDAYLLTLLQHSDTLYGCMVTR
jgi:zinc transport system substrate-binding protein